MNLLKGILLGYSAYNALKPTKSEVVEETTVTTIDDFEEAKAAFEDRLQMAQDYIQVNRDVKYNIDYSEQIYVNLTGSITSTGNKKWDSSWVLTIENTSDADLQIFGIVVKNIKIATIPITYCPISREDVEIRIGNTRQIKMTGTNNEVIVTDKEDRKKLKGAFDGAGKHNLVKGTCDIYMIFLLRNGEFVLRTIKNADCYAAYDGNKNVGGGLKAKIIYENQLQLLNNMITKGDDGQPFKQ